MQIVARCRQNTYFSAMKKKENNSALSVRIPDDLKNEVIEAANEQDRSLTSMTKILLKEGLKKVKNEDRRD